MKYFNILISKIEELEDNFTIINSRIIEFGKSTDNKHLDLGLLTKYSEVLDGYVIFLESEKIKLGENIDKNSSSEYLATKKLVKLRLNEGIKQINIVLKKVNEILKINTKKLSTEKIDEIFKSSAQMNDIKKLLEQFNKELVVYKKVQELIGIKIDLDDKIEKELETTKTDEDLLQTQRFFIEKTGDFLGDILEDRNIRYKEIIKRKDLVFESISNKNNFEKLFYTILKKKYTIGLDVEKSNLYLDYKKFELLNSNLDLLLDISDFCKNYDRILTISKKNGFEKFISDFYDINKFLNEKILSIKSFNLEKIIEIIEKEIGIKKLKSLIFYMDSFSAFIKNYDKLSKIDFSIVDSKYNSGFVEFFKDNINGKTIINKFIDEHKRFISNKLRKININLGNIVKNEKYFIEINKDLELFYNGIISFNISIANYTYSIGSLKLLRKDLNTTLFLKSKDFFSLTELKTYYNQVISKVHKLEKKIYLVRKRSSYSSSNSRSSSNSYSGSSSWSSSSSSGSSSYSSSGSSSW